MDLIRELRIRWHMWRAERLEVSDEWAAIAHILAAHRLTRERSAERLEQLEAKRMARLMGRA